MADDIDAAMMDVNVGYLIHETAVGAAWADVNVGYLIHEASIGGAVMEMNTGASRRVISILTIPPSGWGLVVSPPIEDEVQSDHFGSAYMELNMP